VTSSPATIGETNENGHYLPSSQASDGVVQPKKRKSKEGKSPIAKKNRPFSYKISPNKNDSAHVVSSVTSTPTTTESPHVSTQLTQNKSLPLPNEICDVCNTVGSSQNLVK
jgi:hypothetical protein